MKPAKQAAPLKKFPARFYQSSNGSEPVRDWLKSDVFSRKDRKKLGEDIATVEKGWPLGMPLCDNLGGGLWEIRSSLSGKREPRIIFCVVAQQLVLLHGFIKKTQKTPQGDLKLAQKRKKEIE
jgi:phage-related protein